MKNEKGNDYKRFSFKLYDKKTLDEFEALCFYFSETQQGVFEMAIRELYKNSLKEHPALKKTMEVILEKEDKFGK